MIARDRRCKWPAAKYSLNKMIGKVVVRQRKMRYGRRGVGVWLGDTEM